MTKPVAVLIGPPGAGKSSTGRALAARLGVDFTDTDELVVRAAGMPVTDIFVEHGEAEFRRLEAKAVRAALEEATGVVALGGGAVLSEETRAVLAGHVLVFLDVGITDAAKRIGFNRDRPLLLGNPRQQWLKLMEQRRPVYESLATAHVQTDGRTPAEVADDIAAALGVGA